MNGRFKNIVAYLNEKTQKQFTGSVKLGFDNGGLISINEANKFDIETSPADSKEIVNECLELASDKLFNGTIVFSFDNGCITSYAYIKTYKGETLRTFMKNYEG